jgi:hypothetical protein
MKGKFFIISLLGILLASIWLVLHAAAQEQSPAEKADDSSDKAIGHKLRIT